MSCLDNTDILRIVGGNSFQIAITVKARRVSDGSEIEDFDLSASSPVLNLIHAGEKTRKYFVTQGNQAIISFDGSEGLGYYGMEMSGSYDSEAWRFCIEKVLQLVDTNAKANIPEWSVLVDDTYFIEGTISIYGGGGGGDTVQADWTETNPTSAAFILHKPDLSVYATKAEVASGLAGKQDTIADLANIREGADAGATAYQKPGTGIPESDMSEGVQTSLGKADSAYQKPSSGIPATDMSEGVQAALEKANSAVQTETDPVFSNSPAAEISQTDINNWNAKQPSIADLADIREGAAAGATAVQPDEMAQAIDVVEGDIADINAKIPTAASNLNQLADKAYVNSSIATNSATYRGSFNLITDLGMNVDATHAQIAGALATAIATADNNDYAFVQIPDSASTPTVIAKIERYKHNGSGWVYEYDLNNSGFTSAQWAAINSGITSGLVGKLSDLPNNSELATLLNGKQNVINDLSAIRSGASAGATAVQPADLTEALNDVEDEIAGLDESKQDTIEDLSTIRSGAAAGATAYQKPASGIPESDMSDGVHTSLGKADSAYQKPASGIPASDMDSDVQASLEKANSAVQTETDPVFSNSPAAEITQADINNWNAKQSAIGDLADIREGAAAGATAVQPDEMAQAIDGVEGDIADINAKIPSTASNLNQLADKAYVNSSIATNSATYRGSFNLITDLGMNVDATHAQIAGALATAITTADNNDYAFVQIPDSASTPTVIAKIERYKHNGSGWVYEYDLNNSGFTAAQWAAINSGITSSLVGKLSDLPNNSELATLLNGKQNVINDLSAIRSGASAGSTAYQKPSSGIPASDMSSTVQQELSKANTAVQTETDPIFSASPAAGITAQNIQTWNGEPAARQAADTALQNSVSTLQTDLAAETSARQSADTALQTAIQNEATARATADALLQQQYNALTQSDIIVGALPASGVPNVIYRVPGTTDFTDYMWYDNQFVPMATYGLPISAEFVVDSNLNKTQEEVNGEFTDTDSTSVGFFLNHIVFLSNSGISPDNGGILTNRDTIASKNLIEIPKATQKINFYQRTGGDYSFCIALFDNSKTFLQRIYWTTNKTFDISQYSTAKYVRIGVSLYIGGQSAGGDQTIYDLQSIIFTTNSTVVDDKMSALDTNISELAGVVNSIKSYYDTTAIILGQNKIKYKQEYGYGKNVVLTFDDTTNRALVVRVGSLGTSNPEISIIPESTTLTVPHNNNLWIDLTTKKFVVDSSLTRNNSIFFGRNYFGYLSGGCFDQILPFINKASIDELDTSVEELQANKADAAKIFGYNFGEAEFVDGKSISPSNGALISNPTCIASNSFFRVPDGSAKIIFRDYDKSDHNRIVYNIAYYTSNGQSGFISRDTFSEKLEWDVPSGAKYIRVILALKNSSGTEIGGNQSDYNLDSVTLSFDDCLEMRLMDLESENLEQKIESLSADVVGINFRNYEFNDHKNINPNTGNLADNTDTIASEVFFKIPNGANKIVFKDTDTKDGYKIRYNIAFYESAIASSILNRTSYDTKTVWDIYPGSTYVRICMALLNGSSSIGGTVSDYNLEDVFMLFDTTINQRMDDIESQMDESYGQVNKYGYTYDGERINVKPRLRWKSLVRSEHTAAIQGGAAYGDYYFQFHGQNNKNGQGQATLFYGVEIFNLANRTKVQEILLGFDILKHNNSVTFGPDFYATTDRFPLLYASQENENARYCLVYRILETGSESAPFALTLVQAISLPPYSEANYFYPNCFIDAVNRRIVYSGLESWNASDYKFEVYPLPSVSDGTSVSIGTIDISDDGSGSPSTASGYTLGNGRVVKANDNDNGTIIKDYQLYHSSVLTTYKKDWINPYTGQTSTMQGGVVSNNTLYQAFGGENNCVLKAYDIDTGVVKSTVNLSAIGTNYEPEAAFVFEGCLGLSFNGWGYAVLFDFE